MIVNGIRELAYVVKIDSIEPIVGSDNCEAAVVGGWRIMVRKGTFKPNDLAVYFEIDSHLDTSKSEFAFLEKKHGNVKTQKYTFGGKNPGFYSQGLLMSAEDFGGFCYQDGDGQFYLHFEKNSFFKKIVDYKVGDPLTEALGVTYIVSDDNKRKAKSNPDAKINAALARHPKIAKKYGKFIKNHKTLRKLFILLFGKKRDNRNWIEGVPKTDEERIQNRVWTLDDNETEWIATEKIDGTSTTFYLKKGTWNHKPEYLVCSRNVVFDAPEKNGRNYYQDSIGNVYLEMSEKYNMRAILTEILNQRPSADWVAVQAETFGAGVQKRDYGMKDHEIRAFNLLYSDCGRVGTLEMRDTLESFGIPCVPVISEGMTLPATIDELIAFVHSTPSAIDGKIKEGIVFRTKDGKDSFKCVDPEFLVKYHQ
jgi:hypothetical protein